MLSNDVYLPNAHNAARVCFVQCNHFSTCVILGATWRTSVKLVGPGSARCFAMHGVGMHKSTIVNSANTVYGTSNLTSYALLVNSKRVWSAFTSNTIIYLQLFLFRARFNRSNGGLIIANPFGNRSCRFTQTIFRAKD